MTQIIKGGNLPLSGEPMRVAVVRRSGGAGAPEVDAAALLVDSGGRVRGRGDLVFYNQPEHAGSGVRLTGHAQREGGVVADWLEIDPGRVEPAVDRIVVAASCDGGTFGEVEDLYLRAVSATTGEQLAQYVVEDATTETAILLGEFYRRNDGWKFRAVGQGYASGLPGLAADFGFSVGDGPGAEEEFADGTGATEEVAGAAAFPAASPPAPTFVDVPAPASPAVPAPAPALVPAPAPIPAPIPVLVPAVAKAGGPVSASVAPLGVAPGRCNALPGEFGPEFPYVEYMGRGKEDVEPELSLPRGFLVVDVMKKGAGEVDVVTLTIRRRRWRPVLRSRIANLRGVGVFHHDGTTPIRIRVDTQGQWMIRLRPVSTLRSFDGPLEGFGPDVLAYTGEKIDVKYRFQGDEDKSGASAVSVHRRGGHREPAFNEWGRGRGTGSIPRGPRLLVVEAAGGWSLEPRPAGSGGFWTRRR
ncbi:TerD family protein [Streptomyces zaomyceticus]|uniref:TerD family protein n=1 Tax=Streptomyces zaomyceticus TaxID=68286 RepID=UPI0016792720|nr:TerD family protein [Streptomyces zaomyceticus]GHG25918.1 resistance protein [Streptomyces zaomyceticus]